ncbi:hypothetical protein JKP88DRAFT_305066 [Tribonema minus]|uniref:Uncharacterized protein n=1 Tax=Tribonema minus TaxID=303371 RepID=A0A835Z8B0_9STRA|nr:hypothetical protein JKP88DRAFT_305066 [Tribonema minus]
MPKRPLSLVKGNLCQSTDEPSAPPYVAPPLRIDSCSVVLLCPQSVIATTSPLALHINILSVTGRGTIILHTTLPMSHGSSTATSAITAHRTAANYQSVLPPPRKATTCERKASPNTSAKPLQPCCLYPPPCIAYTPPPLHRLLPAHRRLGIEICVCFTQGQRRGPRTSENDRQQPKGRCRRRRGRRLRHWHSGGNHLAQQRLSELPTPPMPPLPIRTIALDALCRPFKASPYCTKSSNFNLCLVVADLAPYLCDPAARKARDAIADLEHQLAAANGLRIALAAQVEEGQHSTAAAEEHAATLAAQLEAVQQHVATLAAQLEEGQQHADALAAQLEEGQQQAAAAEHSAAAAEERRAGLAAVAAMLLRKAWDTGDSLCALQASQASHVKLEAAHTALTTSHQALLMMARGARAEVTELHTAAARRRVAKDAAIASLRRDLAAANAQLRGEAAIQRDVAAAREAAHSAAVHSLEVNVAALRSSGNSAVALLRAQLAEARRSGAEEIKLLQTAHSSAVAGVEQAAAAAEQAHGTAVQQPTTSLNDVRSAHAVAIEQAAALQARLNAQVARMEEAAAAARQAHSAAVAQLTGDRDAARRPRLRLQQRELRDKTEELEIAREQKDDARISSRKELQLVQEQRANAWAAQSAAERERNDLRATLCGKDGEVQQARALQRRSDDQRDSALAARDAAQQETARLRTQLNQQAGEVRQLHVQLDEANKAHMQLVRARLELDVAQAESAQLRSKVSEQADELQRLRAQSEEASIAATESSAQLHSTHSDRDTARAECKDLGAALEASGLQLLQARKEAAGVREQVKQVSAELQAERSRAQETVAKLSADLEESKEKVKQLRAQLEEASAAAKDSSAQLRSAQVQCSTAKEEAAQLSAALAAARRRWKRRAQRQRARASNLSTALAEREQQLDVARTEAAGASAELQQANAQLQAERSTAKQEVAKLGAELQASKEKVEQAHQLERRSAYAVFVAEDKHKVQLCTTEDALAQARAEVTKSAAAVVSAQSAAQQQAHQLREAVNAGLGALGRSAALGDSSTIEEVVAAVADAFDAARRALIDADVVTAACKERTKKRGNEQACAMAEKRNLREYIDMLQKLLVAHRIPFAKQSSFQKKNRKQHSAAVELDAQEQGMEAAAAERSMGEGNMLEHNQRFVLPGNDMQPQIAEQDGRSMQGQGNVRPNNGHGQLRREAPVWPPGGNRTPVGN